MMPVVASALILVSHLGQPPPVAVVGRPEGSFECNLAVVRGLDSGSLLVRVGPGRHHRIVGHLFNGDRVYTCNERRPWLGVVFQQPGVACAAPEGRGIDNNRARSCRAGWVHRDWIEILTG